MSLRVGTAKALIMELEAVSPTTAHGYDRGFYELVPPLVTTSGYSKTLIMELEAVSPTTVHDYDRGFYELVPPLVTTSGYSKTLIMELEAVSPTFTLRGLAATPVATPPTVPTTTELSSIRQMVSRRLQNSAVSFIFPLFLIFCVPVRCPAAAKVPALW